ncbi:14-3-3 protein [Diaporthe sp. PMI_573]|nr:14-3-3 protein [Diaporthaceae sp. PMI_573]
MNERESKTFVARLCDQAERYNDMVSCMNDIARLSGELNSDERDLFSVATKNAVGTLRASWRMISSMEQKESSGPQSRSSAARDYRYKIELELEKFCQDVLDILDNLLIPNATSGEFEVFYRRMKGDYHRYLAEIASGEKRSSATAAADEAYKVELKPTHSTRLGLALNFSVFQYEILDTPEPACHLAKQAIHDAMVNLDHLSEESYRNTTLILQLLQDNLDLWASFDNGDGEAEAAGIYEGAKERYFAGNTKLKAVG